jgi:hypothetical protein
MSLPDHRILGASTVSPFSSATYTKVEFSVFFADDHHRIRCGPNVAHGIVKRHTDAAGRLMRPVTVQRRNVTEWQNDAPF